MKRIWPIILIVCGTILFEYNYEITYYFVPDISTGDLYNDWWELRKKIYSGIFMILSLTIFIVTKKLIRIASVPLTGFTIDDFIDRVYFNSPEWHNTDYIIVITTFFVMVMLIYNYARSETRIDKGFY